MLPSCSMRRWRQIHGRRPRCNKLAMLATDGRPDLAQEHLDQLARLWQPPSGPGWSMPSIHAWLLWKQGYWSGEITRMRKLLAEDIEAQSGKAETSHAAEPKSKD